jgi:hypothetical protein
MNKNTHGYMTEWYTKDIYISFVNCFVVILPRHKNLILLALTLVQYDSYSITLFALLIHVVVFMSLEAVLGNKEFEFVVSEVTLTVVTQVQLLGDLWCISTSAAVTSSGSDSLESQTVSLALLTSSTSG